VHVPARRRPRVEPEADGDRDTCQHGCDVARERHPDPTASARRLGARVAGTTPPGRGPSPIGEAGGLQCGARPQARLRKGRRRWQGDGPLGSKEGSEARECGRVAPDRRARLQRGRQDGGRAGAPVPVQHPEHGGRERPHVAGRPRRGPRLTLGCPEALRAAFYGHVCGEVQQHRSAVSAEQDVRGRDVAVHHAVGMEVRQTLSGRGQQPRGLAEVER